MSYYKNKKILVTGGGGIVGQNITKRLLDDGALVTATYYNNRKINIIDNNLKTIYCDFMDMNQCRKIINDYDIIIDAAADIRGAKGMSQNKVLLQMIRNNIIMHLNIITAVVESELPVYCCIGSSTMYPDVSYPVTEDEGFHGTPWHGYRGIGEYKRYVEKICNLYNDTSNTKFVMTRTTALYGPYDSFNPETCHVIPATILKAFNKNNPFQVWGDGTEQRNFIYIDDFVDGFLKVTELEIYGDPINISSKEISTVNDVVKYSIESANYNPQIEYIDAPTMIPYRVVSTEKAKKLLNWKSKTSLKDGIFKTMEWYNTNLKEEIKWTNQK